MAEDNEASEVDDHILVLRAVETHVRDTHQLCSIRDIRDITGLSSEKCEEITAHLSGDQLTLVHGKSGGRGVLQLFMPTYMWEDVLRSEKKPEWVDEEYSFDEEREINEMIRDKKEELNKFAQFKRLLYGKDPPLEEAVAYSLRYLGFEAVKHLGGQDEHDVEFVVEDEKIIIEIGGSFSSIRKDKPKDLTEWIEKATLRPENQSFEQLKGMLIVNHFNETEPTQRGDIFSSHAKRLIRVFNYKVLTTLTLFDLVKKVHQNKIEKGEARADVLKGETPV